MGIGPSSSEPKANDNYTQMINQIVYQLNTHNTKLSTYGPVSIFIESLRKTLKDLQDDIKTLQLSEASSVNLTSVNSSIQSISLSLQKINSDISTLKNQVSCLTPLDNLSNTITDLNECIVSLSNQVGTVNVVGLETIVNNISNLITVINSNLHCKVDKSLTINSKPLTSNIVITKSDVQLSHVSNDPQLKRCGNDYVTFPIKDSASADDMILLEDTSVGGDKYTVKLQSLPLSDAVTSELDTKVNKIDLTNLTLGSPNKTLCISTNDQGQIILGSDTLINILPSQANLSNVQNIDTTSVANSYIKGIFTPVNGEVRNGDSSLNALQKLQGQILANNKVMTGSDGLRDGSSGMVPIPLANKNLSFLRGDGKWMIPTKNVVYANESVNPALTNSIYIVNTTLNGLSFTLPNGVPEGSDITILDNTL